MALLRGGFLLLVAMMALFSSVASGADVLEAVANIYGAGVFANKNQISGTVTFTQTIPTGDELPAVRIQADVRGLPAGAHGFHAHQFGDVRNFSDMSTVGLHFVPLCQSQSTNPEECKKDQMHGLPPSETRQPGDFGNIVADAQGRAVYDEMIGQEKEAFDSAPCRNSAI